jgi:hypothetical protein
MKRALFLLSAAASLFAGCDSLNRPDYFASGRDARVFNPQTGRYEWPDDAPPARPRKPRVSLSDEPANADGRRTGLNPQDDRVFNPQTRQYETPSR